MTTKVDTNGAAEAVRKIVLAFADEARAAAKKAIEKANELERLAEEISQAAMQAGDQYAAAVEDCFQSFETARQTLMSNREMITSLLKQDGARITHESKPMLAYDKQFEDAIEKAIRK